MSKLEPYPKKEPVMNLVLYAFCPSCWSYQPEVHHCPALNGSEVLLAPFSTDSSMSTL
jgi:hypothetical protein